LSEEGKKIRSGIINFFRERDCVTLVRPCNDEQDLKSLQTTGDKNLRPEFVLELNSIRDKVYRHCGPKKLKGVNLTARMYCRMISEYVSALNEGSVPVI
jgi:Guanylate-binding protein, N-terminal domain